MEARLITNDGHFVTDIEIPPFNPPPEIIIWGQRYFVKASTAAEAQLQYKEGMAWVHFPQMLIKPNHSREIQ